MPKTPSSSDPRKTLIDPDLLEPLEMVPEIETLAETLAERREFLPVLAKELQGPPAPQLETFWIPGYQGDPDIEVHLVDPSPGTKGRGAYLYIHGGGYVMFRADRDPALLQDIAMENECIVLAVEYRLAPETPFPGALNDNYASLLWLHANADRLGVDPERIAIGGESAGGGHVAALALAARDRGEVKIAFQMMIYPMLDDRTGSTVSVPDHIGNFLWTRNSNRFGWSALLGVPAGSDDVPIGAVPARATDLAGLPPTFIGTAALDLFLQENLDYARRLIEAGVPTELYVEPRGFHGFDLLVPMAPCSQRFTSIWKSALSRALARQTDSSNSSPT
jgi:acetyl esterase/lipase